MTMSGNETVIPISDLKSTGSISHLCHKNEGPILVTKNGVVDMVIVSPELWRHMEEAELERRLLAEVSVGERAAASGDVTGYRADTERLRAIYGL
jgi:PHD/YefM family antitoxin component YafN of YafNO toxin-antitoxin module